MHPKKSSMVAVMMLALVPLLAFLAAACSSGGGDGDTPQAGETAVADAETPSDGETPSDAETPSDGETPTGGGGGSGGDAFDDVPLPDGADETSNITISGSQFPFFVPTDAGVDADAFGDITMKEYDVDSSPGDVVDFYKDNRGGWDDAFTITTDEGGLLIWTKNDGASAVWISVSEGSDAGTATLAIIQGLTQ